MTIGYMDSELEGAGTNGIDNADLTRYTFAIGYES